MSCPLQTRYDARIEANEDGTETETVGANMKCMYLSFGTVLPEEMVQVRSEGFSVAHGKFIEVLLEVLENFLSLYARRTDRILRDSDNAQTRSF